MVWYPLIRGNRSQSARRTTRGTKAFFVPVVVLGESAPADLVTRRTRTSQPSVGISTTESRSHTLPKQHSADTFADISNFGSQKTTNDKRQTTNNKPETSNLKQETL